jgi:O-methyltransferase
MKAALKRILLEFARKAFHLNITRTPIQVNGDWYVEDPVENTKRFAPWLSEEFAELYRSIATRTLVSRDRCYVLHTLASQAIYLSGNFAECGVFRGGTAYMLATILSRSRRRKSLHLFDTFSGMPDSAVKERDGHKPGDFGDTSLGEVREYLREYETLINFYPGSIPQTFRDLEQQTYSFVYLDLDIYPATRDAITFFYPRLTPGGFIVCDDYGFPGYQAAAKAAIDEFVQDKQEAVLVLNTGQALLTKLP